MCVVFPAYGKINYTLLSRLISLYVVIGCNSTFSVDTIDNLLKYINIFTCFMSSSSKPRLKKLIAFHSYFIHPENNRLRLWHNVQFVV